MSERREPLEPVPLSTPILGRVLAAAVALFFVMVTLGVLWIWRSASREQQWRDRVNAAEPIIPAQRP